MYSRFILLVAAALLSSAVYSEELDIQLGGKSARFMYMTEAFGQEFGRLEMEAGILYNENSNYMANFGLLVRGESVSVPMIVALGARAYGGKLDQYTVAAIAIGGDLLLNPVAWGGAGLGAYYYAAPGVVAFRDAKDLTEYGIYFNYQVTPQASVELGYRVIDVEIKDVGKFEMDKGGYFGLNITF